MDSKYPRLALNIAQIIAEERFRTRERKFLSPTPLYRRCLRCHRARVAFIKKTSPLAQGFRHTSVVHRYFCQNKGLFFFSPMTRKTNGGIPFQDFFRSNPPSTLSLSFCCFYFSLTFLSIDAIPFFYEGNLWSPRLRSIIDHIFFFFNTFSFLLNIE